MDKDLPTDKTLKRNGSCPGEREGKASRTVEPRQSGFLAIHDDSASFDLDITDGPLGWVPIHS